MTQLVTINEIKDKIGLIQLISVTYAYFEVWALVKLDGNTCKQKYH